MGALEFLIIPRARADEFSPSGVELQIQNYGRNMRGGSLARRTALWLISINEINLYERACIQIRRS